jgi:pyridoxal 5'-phosphate synthase pdxT subunit
MQVGVLALQGDFREHVETLRRLGARAVEVRLPADLAAVERLIIPGGESTTIGRLLARYGLLALLRERVQREMPLWGTCAGAIVMAEQILDARPAGQEHLAVMNMCVRRNAFGRQLDSFEADLHLAALGPEPLRGVFIRAPRIEAVGPNVEVLARLDDGTIVAAQQERMLATAFHPELTGDDRLHRYFLEL